MSGDKPKRNSVSKTNPPKSKDNKAKSTKEPQKPKDNDGDEEMTVVVAPAKAPAGKDNDVAMENAEEAKSEEVPIDPKVKAVADIKANIGLLEKAVSQFDSRFTLRVLRSIPSIREHLSASLLAQTILDVYKYVAPTSFALMRALAEEEGFPKAEAEKWLKTKDAKRDPSVKRYTAEVDVYFSLLVQIYLYDSENFEVGQKFSEALVEHLRTLNRRSIDPIAARVYFYLSLFFEETDPLPPSPNAAVTEIRKTLLDVLRTSTLRNDYETQAAVTTLLLRNYLLTSSVTQADLLIEHSRFPESAATSQVARYLYYLGRIRATQLNYSEAHEHLIGATRKAPSSYKASGFYQTSMKLLVVVELLMGDIPDRAVFRQPSLEKSLAPYLLLVQAVSSGDVTGFQTLVQRYNATFRSDNTYTLILRLRQNVIKTGIRMMSLSYARISLRDMCLRLGLDSEESAEYIVAKAIRDGVIEATLDHEHGYMKSKDAGDIYSSNEPFDAYSSRIQACLSLHDESVKAMRFPMNRHRDELKNAQEARERERELAKEIVDGDLDEEDGPGGDFEGL